jgi:hypothetical protein
VNASVTKAKETKYVRKDLDKFMVEYIVLSFKMNICMTLMNIDESYALESRE